MAADSEQFQLFGSFLEGGTRNGIYKPKEFHGNGAKIVNMGELFGHPRMRDIPMKRVSLTVDELNRFVLKRGDLLFARRSLVADGAGKCSVVMEVNEPTVFESSIIRARPDPTRSDSLFLYYFFSSHLGFQALDTIRRDAVVAGITGTDLVQLKLKLPSLHSQQRIAHILGTLDDKIELNRRTNETLEAMARAIFKSWFVDFDPVKAKAVGQKPFGMDDETAALFPSEFEDSELGPIPKGWRVGALGNFCDVDWGDTSLTKSSYVKEGYLAYSASGPDGFLTYFQNTGWGVVVSAIGANAGATWLASNNWNCIKNTLRFWSTSEELSTIALYFASKTPNFFPLRGSAQPFISKGDTQKIPIVISNKGLSKTFDQFVSPIFNQISSNNLESDTLSETRDLLLPRLLSGELSVKYLGEQVNG